MDDPYIEILSRFVKCSMGRRGNNDFGFLDPLFIPRPIPVRLHRQENTFCSPCCDHSADLVIRDFLCPEHIGCHRHDFGFIFEGTWPYV